MFFTYIIFGSSKNRFYVGSTNDLNSRLEKHNAGATPSTKFGRPWIMVYHEAFNSRSEAIKRELAIKKMKSKKYILQLINSKK